MNHIDLGCGSVRCQIVTNKPLPSDAYQHVGRLRAEVEECAAALAAGKEST